MPVRLTRPNPVARCPAHWRARLLALLLLLLLRPGWAALGEAPAAGLSSSRNGYAVHETVYDNGTRVQEFVSPVGLVFAVAWQGPVLPDLSVWLGRFHGSYRLETEQRRLAGLRGGPVAMARDGLVLRSNGRMRQFFGHAYAPALVPAGLNTQDVLP
jgi:hypothetical protein